MPNLRYHYVKFEIYIRSDDKLEYSHSNYKVYCDDKEFCQTQLEDDAKFIVLIMNKYEHLEFYPDGEDKE